MNAQLIQLPVQSPTIIAPRVPFGPRPEIGAKYTGTHKIFLDSYSQTYWESLPLINGDDAHLQRCLLKHAAKEKKKVKKV